jgi:hypothetical protein
MLVTNRTPVIQMASHPSLPLLALVYENEVVIYKNGEILATWSGQATNIAWLPNLE